MYDEYNNIQVQYMNYTSLNKEVNKRDNDQLINNKSYFDTKSPRNKNNNKNDHYNKSCNATVNVPKYN